MRILSFRGIKWDKNYLIGIAATFVLATIFGIVLFKIANIGGLIYEYAKDYVVLIFEFENTNLLISHLFRELFYLYAFFLIAYFTKWKILTLIIFFFRTITCVFYCAILFGSLGFSGIMVALIIYIPCFLISSAMCCVVAETCRTINKKYVAIFPAVIAIIDCVVMLVLLNVIFRILIVIV